MSGVIALTMQQGIKAQNIDIQSSQTVVNEIENPVFSFVEQMPEFVGGEKMLMKFISSNIKYPEQAKIDGIEGRVIISFIVSETGKLTDFNILRDIGGGCGAEAVRVLKLSPDWKPGKQNGKAVRTKMTIPIMFVQAEPEKVQQPDKAQFPGGDESMKMFIGTNLKYPEKAKKKGIEGICKLKVTVFKDGTLSKPEISNSLNKVLDAEAIRVFNLMPKKWLPATINNNYVDSEVEISFEFKLPK
ncbi:MAG: hypothetical protein RIQ33_1826 [Bacteroidota bacterium]